MEISSKSSSSSSSSSKPRSSSSSKTSSSKSTSSLKSTQSSSKTSKPAAPKDSFVASKDGGKPNGAVPNFGSWALAAPTAPQATAKPVPSDPAPRVAPKPAAPEITTPEPQAAQPKAEAPKPEAGAGAAKAFDDASWATAQARHAADFANQAGTALKSTSVANTSASALKPLNPAAGVLGGAAFGKMAYDSLQKGNYGEAAAQGGVAGTLATAGGAGFIKGGEMLAKTAGRAAPAVGGAFQAYEGIKNGDTWDTVSGGAKIAGAAMIATGFGAPVGSALIIGSYMADLGRWGYQKLSQ